MDAPVEALEEVPVAEERSERADQSEVVPAANGADSSEDTI
jgi:hypothetical protein